MKYLNFNFFYTIPKDFLTLFKKKCQEKNEKYYIGDEINLINIDLPGMVALNRTYSVIEIDELNIRIPNQDLEYFIDNLILAETEYLYDIPYYTLKGYLRVIVLTVDMRIKFLNKAKTLLPSIKILGELDKKSLKEGIDDINLKMGNKIIINKNYLQNLKKNDIN